MTNPTQTWTARLDFELVLDVDAMSLNGVAIGQPAQALQDLGPAPSWSRGPDATGTATYPALGIELDIATDGALRRITAICVERVAWTRHRFSPFAGRVSCRGVSYGIADLTDTAAWQAHLGDQFWIHDGDELAWFYEPDGRIELVLAFGASPTGERALERIQFQTPPVLAEPRARDWYGCPLVWPPR